MIYADSLTKGNIGEKLAANYVIKKGYAIISRKYHSRYGEIDIIARDNETIVFIEVKNYSIINLLNPREAIFLKKRKRIIQTARIFLCANGFHGFNCRFDVVAITSVNRKYEIEYIENAFS